MTVRLTRTSYGGLPQSLGIEIDDAGHAASWSTSGHRVGRFARDLSPGERTALESALSSARNADSVTAPDSGNGPVAPSGSSEQLVADGLDDVVLDGSATAPPGSADLIELLRKLGEDLADSPVAAIELVVDGSPLAARLRHVGTEPVVVRSGTITVQATVFGKDSAIVDSATHTVDAPSEYGPVSAGWTLPLVDDLGVPSPPRRGFMTVNAGTVEVDSLGDGVLRGTEFSWITE